MRKDAHFLRFALAAVFLSLSAYIISGFAETMTEPVTVTAKKVTVSKTVCAEGRVIRDEIKLSLPEGRVSPSVAFGERVRAGQAVCTVNGKSILSPCAGFFAGDRIVRNGWYFEAELNDLSSFYVGMQLTLSLGGAEYPAQVEGLDGNKLTLRCRAGLCDVLDIYSSEAILDLGSVTGLKLPDTAAVYENGDCFVYVLRGDAPSRTQVEPVFRDKAYLLVRPGDIGEGARVLRDPRNTAVYD